MTKAGLQLGALTCPSCMQKIQGALEKQAGVQKVKVLFNASKVKLEFDDSANTADALAEVVKKLGYEVKSVKVKQPAE
ncbi:MULTISPECIES: heavy metal-associated domain-containing protein [Pediococcus]|nr:MULTISPECIES: heavy metal-associated domain-containing protein [Pediococcus]MCT3029619.1 heavy-metal-associated domain-containing protein [Pediococcus parvulus]MCT3030779.1 heavy-metal-associated domain-containing protein [Pediococcus parvulus]MCT3034432.1 heavy-metal-associated domain-containing protein [Pediococcus parvulus]HBO46876.1 heavy metal-binding protein [Pediococcus sp.]